MPDYTLDFETIRQMLQAYQQTGILSAEVPSGIGRLREACHVELDVMSGVITSCTIVSIRGRSLTGKEAIEGLFHLGRLRWSFMPQVNVATQEQEALTPREKGFFPLRTVARLEPGQMRSLSRLHRAVFALADGTKSATKIAEVLSTSPVYVNRALGDLQSIGVIALARENGKDHV